MKLAECGEYQAAGRVRLGACSKNDFLIPCLHLVGETDMRDDRIRLSQYAWCSAPSDEAEQRPLGAE